jgi:hypothetical protein
MMFQGVPGFRLRSFICDLDMLCASGLVWPVREGAAQAVDPL